MRIAIWSESKWALARIHSDISRILSDKHEFVFFDWGQCDQSQKFFETYETFDIILGNTAILFSPIEMKFMQELPKKYLARCLVILHCPILNHGTFTEKLCINNLSTFTGVSPKCCSILSDASQKPIPWTPFGVSTELFRKKEPTNITPKLKIAGFVGRTNLKGLDTFMSICKRTNLVPYTISGYDYQFNADIYANIDILICCSPFEAGPLGNFEAASLGIPVLSTKVGNWSFVKSAKFFSTEDEAVEIINRWSLNETFVPYSIALQQDVRTNWSNEVLIPKTLGTLIDEFGICIDLLDIGANYVGSSRSIHVDPLRVLWNHNGTIERVAILETPLEPVAYYTDDEFPLWIRGCTSVGSVHPSLISGNHNIKSVPIVHTTLDKLIRKHNLRYIDMVSIVVEGYDTTIATELLNLIIQKKVFVKTVKMLTNSLHDSNDVKLVTEKYIQHGYTSTTENDMTIFSGFL